jgi:hypothetical protein
MGQSHATKQEFLEGNDTEGIELWDDEKVEGDLILEVREIDGLGDVEPIFKEKTKREKLLDEAFPGLSDDQ